MQVVSVALLFCFYKPSEIVPYKNDCDHGEQHDGPALSDGFLALFD